MTKLKTLKDLGFIDCSPTGTPDRYRTLNDTELKQEAIKWIKN